MSKRIAIVLLGLALAGCGSKEEDAVVFSPKPVKRAKPVVPVDPLAVMAQAVPEDKKGTMLKVKYNLSARPLAGQRVDIDVAFVFASDSKGATVTFAGMPGLQLDDQPQRLLAAARAGQSEQQKVGVTPTQNGLYYVSVNVKADPSQGGAAYNFWIPMVVSAEVPQPAVAAPPAPAKKAS